MTHPRIPRPPTPRPTLGLALAITLLSASSSSAQPLSSGSGVGTGTGASGGAARNSTGTGFESGTGLLLPGANTYISPSGPGGHLLSPGRSSGAGAAGMGPGAATTFPGEMPVLQPNVALDSGLISNAAAGATVTDRHLDYARRIPNPADRSLTLSRIASGATASGQLDVAETALNEASAGGMLIPTGMVRDQRMISIIIALMNLGDARLREGRADAAIPPTDTGPATTATTTTTPAAPAAATATPTHAKPTRVALIRQSQADWLRAADLAQRIGNPTYRSEFMYRVADSMAYGGQTIVNEFPPPETGLVPSTDGWNRSYDGLPDRMLQLAANLCARIERPVWRDRGLVSVASAAAESRQFPRALSVARMIPQPEVRTDALLKIAEIQARRNDLKGATATYGEAARAIASIPLDDPRAVLAGVLIDNLIAVGRFDDARASIALYPDNPRRLVALGAIAESQGLRGSAGSALAWINRDVPAEHRSQLYRRVSNGVVISIEHNRSRDLTKSVDK